jgi:hypothetical protein
LAAGRACTSSLDGFLHGAVQRVGEAQQLADDRVVEFAAVQPLNRSVGDASGSGELGLGQLELQAAAGDLRVTVCRLGDRARRAAVDGSRVAGFVVPSARAVKRYPKGLKTRSPRLDWLGQLHHATG